MITLISSSGGTKVDADKAVVMKSTWFKNLFTSTRDGSNPIDLSKVKHATVTVLRAYVEYLDTGRIGAQTPTI